MVNLNFFIIILLFIQVFLFSSTSALQVSTIAGNGTGGFLYGPVLLSQFNFPFAVAINPLNGDIIVADSGNNKIRMINVSSLIVSTIGGDGTYGFLDGPASSSKFNYPQGVAVDPLNGNIIVGDTFNNRIRMINVSSLIVSTIGGNGTGGFLDGDALLSKFNGP